MSQQRNYWKIKVGIEEYITTADQYANLPRVGEFIRMKDNTQVRVTDVEHFPFSGTCVVITASPWGGKE